MRYFQTDLGNIFDENGNQVIQVDGHPTYVAYLAFLFNGGSIEQYIGLHPQEIAWMAIETEYNKYVQRQADGVDAYLRISAELRIAKLAGSISNTQHKVIEAILEPVRSEVVLGQWIGAKEKLELIDPQDLVPESFYWDLMARIDAYIANNY